MIKKSDGQRKISFLAIAEIVKLKKIQKFETLLKMILKGDALCSRFGFEIILFNSFLKVT